MSKNKIKPADNVANMKNPNLGTNGVNQQFSKANGNKGKLLNPTFTNSKTTKK